jgi:hypothetical protein
MSPEQITMRHSPFLFIRRLVAIQFFFALLPFLAVLVPWGRELLYPRRQRQPAAVDQPGRALYFPPF